MFPSRHVFARRLLVTLLVMIPACAARLQTHEFHAATRGVALRVTNKSVDDRQVFLVRSGTAIRLGLIQALSTRVFWISDAQLGSGGDLELRAAARSNSYVQRSATFSASVGQRIEWVIEDQLPSEVVIVR